MVANRDIRIAQLETQLAHLAWATKTHWRTEFLHKDNIEGGWSSIGEKWDSLEAAQEAAKRYRQIEHIFAGVRIIKVAITTVETEVSNETSC